MTDEENGTEVRDFVESIPELTEYFQGGLKSMKETEEKVLVADPRKPAFESNDTDDFDFFSKM